MKLRSLQRRIGRQLLPPFVGQITCDNCGKTIQASPETITNWRAIDANRKQRYNACPACHPDDASPSLEWEEFLIKVVAVLSRRPGIGTFQTITYYREKDGRADRPVLFKINRNSQTVRKQAHGQEK